MKFEFEDVFITGANGWLGRQIVESLITNDPDVLILEKPKNMIINCLINVGESKDFLIKYGNKVKIFQLQFRLHIKIRFFK
jgi:nucleoside-diphosphate-sugar epimerase